MEKYRLWDKEQKQFVGSYSNGIHMDPCSGELYIGGLNVTNRYIKNPYCGLHDKNDKEIYEGDIYHQGDKNIKYVVAWHDTGFVGKQLGSTSYAGLSYWKDKIEIIGNKFNNPEMLKGVE